MWFVLAANFKHVWDYFQISFNAQMEYILISDRFLLVGANRKDVKINVTVWLVTVPS